MITVIPAIISTNLEFARERIGQVIGVAKKVQLDFVDGKYAPTLTWPFDKNQGDELLMMVRGEERFPYVDEVELEADLLIYHPIELIPDLITIGIKSFVVHIDSTDHLKECIETIKNSGAQLGLGIKPYKDIQSLDNFLSMADFVQFMGNDKAGFNGVTLDNNVIPKIAAFHTKHPSVPIQIDIGVNSDTVPELKDAGVTRFISGSAIYSTADPKEAIHRLEMM